MRRGGNCATIPPIMPPRTTAATKRKSARRAVNRAQAKKATSAASPTAQLDAFLDKFTPDIAAQARVALRRMRARLPGAQELVYDNYNALAIGFSPTDRTSEALFSIAVFPRWVSLFFLQNGTCLRDPDCYLEGTRQPGPPHQARQRRHDRRPRRPGPHRPGPRARPPAHRPRPAPPPHHQIDLAETAPAPSCRKIAALGFRLPYFRSLFRITSFSPDHTASTAHTFTSTNPSGRQTSRTVSSVMSVATPEPPFSATKPTPSHPAPAARAATPDVPPVPSSASQTSAPSRAPPSAPLPASAQHRPPQSLPPHSPASSAATSAGHPSRPASSTAACPNIQPTAAATSHRAADLTLLLALAMFRPANTPSGSAPDS